MARIAHGTLTANAVATITLDNYVQMITVTNRSLTGEIYFTTDNSTPVVLGSNSFVCLGTRIVSDPSVTSPTVVKLISIAALNYSVEGETA